jgi:hypothetical protein
MIYNGSNKNDSSQKILEDLHRRRASSKDSTNSTRSLKARKRLQNGQKNFVESAETHL